MRLYNGSMKVSAQEEYGLRCLLQMTRLGDEESLSIAEISRAEGLSVPNVAKLMRILRLGGLVCSVRGQAGGYVLARPAENITMDQVLQVLGGPLFGTRFCELHTGIERTCTRRRDCSIRPVWLKMQELVGEVLSRTSLKDLLRDEPQMREWLANTADNRRDCQRDAVAGTNGL
jgi:Rrf2 family transcriptional regulator, iron-sulfur cluster assembly transcription factor